MQIKDSKPQHKGDIHLHMLMRTFSYTNPHNAGFAMTCPDKYANFMLMGPSTDPDMQIKAAKKRHNDAGGHLHMLMSSFADSNPYNVVFAVPRPEEYANFMLMSYETDPAIQMNAAQPSIGRNNAICI